MSPRRATGSAFELCTRNLAWSFSQNPAFPGHEEWTTWCEGGMTEAEEGIHWSRVTVAIYETDVDSFSPGWADTAIWGARVVQEIGKLYERLKKRCEAGNARFENEEQSRWYVAASYCSGLHPRRRGQEGREVGLADPPQHREETTDDPEQEEMGGEELAEVGRELAEFEEGDFRDAVLETVKNTIAGVLLRHWSVLVGFFGGDPLSALKVLMGRQHWGEWPVPEDASLTVGDVLQEKCCKTEGNMHQHTSRLRRELKQALSQILTEEE